jgi:hypothetical protein
MRQFSLVAANAEPALCVVAKAETWFLLDVAMTAVMLGMTAVFIGALALSLI